ncbi:hypothetical protein YC2023_116117 [Brassica napus]
MLQLLRALRRLKGYSNIRKGIQIFTGDGKGRDGTDEGSTDCLTKPVGSSPSVRAGSYPWQHGHLPWVHGSKSSS